MRTKTLKTKKPSNKLLCCYNLFTEFVWCLCLNDAQMEATLLEDGENENEKLSNRLGLSLQRLGSERKVVGTH